MAKATMKQASTWLSKNYPLVLLGLAMLSNVKHSALVYAWISGVSGGAGMAYAVGLVLVLDASVMAFTRQGDKTSAFVFACALFAISGIYFIHLEYPEGEYLFLAKWLAWALFAGLPAYTGYRFAHVFTAIRTQTEVERMQSTIEAMAAALDEMQQAIETKEKNYIAGMAAMAEMVQEVRADVSWCKTHLSAHQIRLADCEDWIAERQQKINAGKASANARNGGKEGEP